jgi:hypothetical protein
MGIRTLAWQVPLAGLALWVSLQVVKAIYPNDLLCGETVRTSEEAFNAALKYLREQMPHSLSVPPEKEIMVYRAKYEKCWEAVRKPVARAYWSVMLDLPSTTEDRVYEHWVHVYECGGAAWLGSMPIKAAGNARICR